MSLSEQARRLRLARNVAENCYACGYYGDLDSPHAPDCPYRALPRIVAALEAAERLRRGYGQSTEQGIFARVDVWRYTDEDRDCRFSDKRYVCAGCQAYAETPQQFEHTKTCAAIALVAALHAEE